jgi:hypothetical protein
VFLEPVAVGDSLPEKPLFLTPELYGLLPLEGVIPKRGDPKRSAG